MLSVNFHVPDSYGRVPFDENEFVCLIRGGPCLHFQILTPAYPSQIVCRTVSDSFAPRKVISYDVPLQRVLIKLRPAPGQKKRTGTKKTETGQNNQTRGGQNKEMHSGQKKHKRDKKKKDIWDKIKNDERDNKNMGPKVRGGGGGGRVGGPKSGKRGS